MAAIDLTQLSKQLDNLAACFDDPPAFMKALHEFLGFYNLYAHRPNKNDAPKSFLRTYKLPVQLVRQLEIGLKTRLRAEPAAVLAVVQVLWQDPYFECRNLAAFLLGQLPADQVDLVQNTIFAFLDETLDQAVVDALLNKGSLTIRKESPASWDELIAKLLKNPSSRMQGYGLQALTLRIHESDLVELPVLFKSIRPILQATPPALQTELAQLIRSLAERSPYESAYLLKQALSESTDSSIESQIRSYLDFFPTDIAAGLRQALKNHREFFS